MNVSPDLSGDFTKFELVHLKRGKHMLGGTVPRAGKAQVQEQICMALSRLHVRPSN